MFSCIAVVCTLYICIFIDKYIHIYSLISFNNSSFVTVLVLPMMLLLAAIITIRFMTIVFWRFDSNTSRHPMDVLDGSHFHWGSLQREKPTDSSADCKVSNMYLWNEAAIVVGQAPTSSSCSMCLTPCNHHHHHHHHHQPSRLMNTALFNGSNWSGPVTGSTRSPHTLGIDWGPWVQTWKLQPSRHESKPQS